MKTWTILAGDRFLIAAKCRVNIQPISLFTAYRKNRLFSDRNRDPPLKKNKNAPRARSGCVLTHLRSSADQSSPPKAPCDGEGKKLINASKMRRMPHAGCHHRTQAEVGVEEVSMGNMRVVREGSAVAEL